MLGKFRPHHGWGAITEQFLDQQFLDRDTELPGWYTENGTRYQFILSDVIVDNLTRRPLRRSYRFGA
jgi:hypothetical protein